MLNSLFVITVVVFSLLFLSFISYDEKRYSPIAREWDTSDRAGVTGIILLIIVGILNIINYAITA